MKKWLASPYFIIFMQLVLVIILLCTPTYDPNGEIDFANMDMSNVSCIYILPARWGSSDVYYDCIRLSDEDAAMLLPELNQVALTGIPERERSTYPYSTKRPCMFYISPSDFNVPNFYFAADTECYVVDGSGYKSNAAVGAEIVDIYWQLHDKYFGTEYT